MIQDIGSPGRLDPPLQSSKACTLRRTCKTAPFSICCVCSLGPSSPQKGEGGFQTLSWFLEIKN